MDQTSPRSRSYDPCTKSTRMREALAESAEMVMILKVCLFMLILLTALGFTVTLWWYVNRSSELWTKVYDESSIASILSPCTLPSGGTFRSWKHGLVTVMKPEISKNCSLLFQGDPDEIERVREQNKMWNGTRNSNKFFDWALTGNCSRIREDFFGNFYTSREEMDFPLAFSINVHNNAQQVVRMLKVIYRPHNLYCIHYDLKAPSKFRQVFDNLAKCLSNVFIPSKIIKVNWGDVTILDAQLSCITDLYKARIFVEWQYLITLCGKELPMRTNLEMVQLLKPLNGTSALIPLDIPEEERWRVELRNFVNRQGDLIQTRRRLGRVPYNLKLYKSSAYFGLTPQFVDYVLHDEKANALLRYMHRGVSSAEEHFYSTLYVLPGMLIHIPHVVIGEPCSILPLMIKECLCITIVVPGCHCLHCTL